MTQWKMMALKQTPKREQQIQKHVFDARSTQLQEGEKKSCISLKLKTSHRVMKK